MLSSRHLTEKGSAHYWNALFSIAEGSILMDIVTNAQGEALLLGFVTGIVNEYQSAILAIKMTLKGGVGKGVVITKKCTS